MSNCELLPANLSCLTWPRDSQSRTSWGRTQFISDCANIPQVPAGSPGSLALPRVPQHRTSSFGEVCNRPKTVATLEWPSHSDDSLHTQWCLLNSPSTTEKVSLYKQATFTPLCLGREQTLERDISRGRPPNKVESQGLPKQRKEGKTTPRWQVQGFKFLKLA